MNCEDVRETAAIALLTRSPLGAEIDEHLGSCGECREELAGLAPLPGLLALLDSASLEVGEAAAPGSSPLLDRLLAAAASERRQRRTRLLAVAAAVVLLLAVPVAVWGSLQLRDRSTQVTATTKPTAIDRTARDASTGISGRAQVWKAAWGSDLTLSISGVPSGTLCTVVVVTTDGQSETAATWKASYTGTAQVRGTVAAPVGSILRIDIVDDGGKVLLRI